MGGYCIKAVGSIAYSGGKQLFDTNNIKDYATAISAPRYSLPYSSDSRQIYDLNGRRLPHDAMLPRGVYIIKEGGTTQKVTITR